MSLTQKEWDSLTNEEKILYHSFSGKVNTGILTGLIIASVYCALGLLSFVIAAQSRAAFVALGYASLFFSLLYLFTSFALKIKHNKSIEAFHEKKFNIIRRKK